MPNNKYKRILLLRQDRIGDVLVSTPFLKFLRKEFADSQIDVLLGNGNKAVGKLAKNYADKVFYYNKSLFATFLLLIKLRFQKYDLIVDLLDNPSRTSRLLIKLLKPKNALGFAGKNSDVYTLEATLPNRLENHIVVRILELLRPLGYNPKGIKAELEYPLDKETIEKGKLAFEKDDIENGIIAINLSGSNDHKYWGFENNIQLINSLSQNYPKLSIYLFAYGKYTTIANEISKMTKAKITHNIESLDIMAAAISNCRLMITPDTSVVHICSAFKIPVVSLHKYIEDERYGMPWTAIGVENIALTHNSNIKQIEVNSVVDAVNKLLN